MTPFLKNIEDLKRIKTEIGNTRDAAKLAELNKELEATTQKLGNTSESMERFERLALKGFNAAIKSGVDYLDAVDQLNPALDQLTAAHKALGTEAGPALAELLRFRDITKQNPELVQSAAALNEVTLALSNMAALDSEALADLESQGLQTFQNLTAAGFTERQSLQQMKGFLESVRDAHRDLKTPIDANTQALIDQATSQGILKAEGMSTNDIMMQGLGAIIEALKGKLPEAWKTMKEAAVASTTEAGQHLTANVGGALDGVATKMGATPWSEWTGRASTKTTEAGQAVSTQVGRALDGVAAKLGATPWSEWTGRASTKTTEAGQALHVHVGGALDGLVAKLGATPWGEWAGRAGAETDATGKSIDANVKARLEALAVKLGLTPWSDFAGRAKAAALDAKTSIEDAGGAVGGVAWKLNNTDWRGWGRAIADGAYEAKGAVDSLSFGESPGGIKELPIQLAAAARAAGEFGLRFIRTMTQAKGAVEAIEPPAVDADLSPITESIDGVIHKLATTPWGAFVTAAKTAAQDAAEAMATQEVDVDLGPVLTSIRGVIEKIRQTPWGDFATEAKNASQEAEPALEATGSAAGAVADELETADWTSWGRKLVEAARSAKVAVDALSLGTSPGGIKQIPLELASAVQAAGEFGRRFVQTMTQAKGAADDVSAGVEPITVDVDVDLTDIRLALSTADQLAQAFAAHDWSGWADEIVAASTTARRAIETVEAPVLDDLPPFEIDLSPLEEVKAAIEDLKSTLASVKGLETRAWVTDVMAAKDAVDELAESFLEHDWTGWSEDLVMAASHAQDALRQMALEMPVGLPRQLTDVSRLVERARPGTLAMTPGMLSGPEVARDREPAEETRPIMITIEQHNDIHIDAIDAASFEERIYTEIGPKLAHGIRVNTGSLRTLFQNAGLFP